MIRKTLTIFSLVGLLLSSCCPPDAFDCIYFPFAIEGCPTEAVSIGEPVELRISSFVVDVEQRLFVWFLLTDEGLVSIHPNPVEEFEVVDASAGRFNRIHVTPKQEGVFTLTAYVLTQDSTNLAQRPTCTFEVVSE